MERRIRRPLRVDGGSVCTQKAGPGEMRVAAIAKHGIGHEKEAISNLVNY